MTRHDKLHRTHTKIARILATGNYTASEIALHLDMTVQSISARIKELERMGVAKATPEKRKTPSRSVCSVWSAGDGKVQPLPNARPRKTAAHILALTAAYFQITEDTLTGPSQSPPIARARQIGMYMARRYCTRGRDAPIGWGSLRLISNTFGRRDHTTAWHANRRISELRCADPEIADHVAAIEALMVLMYQAGITPEEFTRRVRVVRWVDEFVRCPAVRRYRRYLRERDLMVAERRPCEMRMAA